jgi:hypothetical protein
LVALSGAMGLRESVLSALGVSGEGSTSEGLPASGTALFVIPVSLLLELLLAVTASFVIDIVGPLPHAEVHL